LLVRRMGLLALVVGVSSAGASMAACAGSGSGPGGDDGGTTDDGASGDARHDGAGGDSSVHDGAVHDASHDAKDASDAGDGSGDDANEAGDDASEAGDDAREGGDDGGDAADGDAGDSSIADASDGGAGNDASDAGNGSDADAGAILGSIFVENYAGSQPQGMVFAAFYDTPQSSNCTTTVYGACTYNDCPNAADGGTPVSAGTLTVAGGALGNNGVALSPQANGTYTYQVNGALFSQGDTMSASASGANVPAFGPETVVGTGLVGITAPLANMQGMYTISTAQDLTVTWTGGESNAQVLIEVEGNSGMNTRYAYCLWDAAAGTGTIPSAALAGLANLGSGVFVWGEWRITNFTAGAYPLQFTALQFDFGQATLQ
jgi:hypothetical protein